MIITENLFPLPMGIKTPTPLPGVWRNGSIMGRVFDLMASWLLRMLRDECSEDWSGWT